MVFDFGFGEILLIAVLVIVFVGPDGLPDMMRVLGRFYGQIRRASDDLRRTFNAEVARVDAEKRREELKQRRLAREKARAEELAAAGGANGAAAPDGTPPEGAGATLASDSAADEPDEPLLLPADPRLPPDAAPRAVPRATPRPSPAAAVPRAPSGPPQRSHAEQTFDPTDLPPAEGAPDTSKEP